MILQKELMAIKQRMLLAADVSKHLANSDGEFLELDAEQYALVHEAMEALLDDCRRVLAELDILRGMFSEKVGLFFMEVANAGDRQGGDGRVAVESVPGAEVVGSGEGPRDDNTATGGRPYRGRASRKQPKGPKPRRNRKSGGGHKGSLDASPGESAMDRSEEA